MWISPACASRCSTAGLRDEVVIDRKHVHEVEARRRELEHCGTPQAANACRVEVRYIYQVVRGFAPEQVFAQTLLGFETVQQSIDENDDGFVGLNFVSLRTASSPCATTPCT